MLKILFLVQKEQRVILDRLYEGVAAHSDCDLRWLDKEDQSNLRRYFERHVEVSRYDRIVFFLRFKQEIRQVAFIRTIPNLLILEHDAYQNYISGKYKGAFSQHYRRLASVRVLTSSAAVTRRLKEEGVDAVFVPKGYDQALLANRRSLRDIELAFVGSTKNGAYINRKSLLDELARHEPLLVTRTNSGEEYVATLNRIRYFVSADIGMGEYMIKNFEAMACGCVLFAYDQGAEENLALGFADMENLVLYRDVAELCSKLAILRADPECAARIAANGQALAEARFSFAHIGESIVKAMEAPLRINERRGWFGRLCLRLGRSA